VSRHRPKTFKEWNLYRMASGYIHPCPDLDTLYEYFDNYPDICLICGGSGQVGVGMFIPNAGIVVQWGPCPACDGVGENGWYCVN
jgi:hypothetical protein